MSSVKHIMFLSKNVKTPLLLEVKVGFVYGLKAPFIGAFILFMLKWITIESFVRNFN